MDVNLIATSGIPEDAIISIRSGAVRRQDCISAGKPFRFPKVSESDCIIKVDIMQTIGTGYIVTKPNQTDGRQYRVVLEGKQKMSCEVEVKAAGVAEATAAAAQQQAKAEAAATKSKEAKEAKEYMESTGLMTFVQGILGVVVKQQPEDPYSAMVQHLLDGYGPGTHPSRGPEVKSPEEPAVVEERRPAAQPSAAAAAVQERPVAAPPTQGGVLPSSPSGGAKGTSDAPAASKEDVSPPAAVPAGEGAAQPTEAVEKSKAEGQKEGFP